MLLRVQNGLGRYLCIALGLVCLIVLFAGCGAYTYGQGGQAQTTPAPTATQQGGSHGQGGQGHSTPTSAPASPQQVQNCGTVNTALNGQPVDRNQARLAGNCFWQAFQHCQAATLLLKEHSLDTGADHTFTIKSNKCSVVDTVKHYIVPNNLITTTTYSCSGLAMQADGLHFIACGQLGSIRLPL